LLGKPWGPGIHISDIPSFPYDLLCSVANLTRRDAQEFMRIAPEVPVHTITETFSLEQANEALDQLRSGKLQVAGVLAIGGTL
jgi:propanol-preferring alcohol dehydrogenase